MITFEKLNKNEMKMIVGGVAESEEAGMNCCAHTEGWGSYRCGYSSADEAQAAASQAAVETGQRTF